MARPLSTKPGDRHGRLTIVSREPNRPGVAQSRWLCRCDCGTELVAFAANFRRGTTVSCGCYASESRSERMRGHQMTGDIAYRSWIQMRARCNDPNHPSFSSYGGRGIYVCQRWDDFTAFLSDMGPRPSRRHSLDRIDNNGPYEPSNCRWATSAEQQSNRRNTVWVTFNGERVPLAKVAKLSALKYNTILERVRKGWNIDDALFAPLGG